MTDRGPVRVLAIDGGGMRGIIPATVLARVEENLGLRAHQAFDLIAGTSTGGIIALALVRGREDGKPLTKAAELASFYENEGPEVFVRRRFEGRLRFGRLGQRPNPSRFIEHALDAYLVDMRLSQALTDVLIPAYEILRREPWVFDSDLARRDSSHDFDCADVAQATAAAPSYFPPVQLTSANARPDSDPLTMIDGGVWANNPSLVALLAARKRWPDREIVMLSLGTGSAKASYSHEQASKWRTFQWLEPALSIVFDAVSDGADAAAGQLLGPRNYLRLDPNISADDNQLDRVDPGFLRRLRRKAEGLLDRRAADIQEFLPKLSRVTPPPPPVTA